MYGSTECSPLQPRAQPYKSDQSWVWELRLGAESMRWYFEQSFELSPWTESLSWACECTVEFPYLALRLIISILRYAHDGFVMLP